MIIILGLLLLTALPTQSKTKDPDEVVISKSDWDSLNVKLNAWLIAAAAFVAREFWGAYKNKGKDIDATLKMLVNSNTKMETTLQTLITRDDAREVAREEVKHYHDLQR